MRSMFRRKRTELKEVFIHFGAHKTGTSYLQYVFSKNGRFFRSQNSIFTHPRFETDAAIRTLKRWQRKGYKGNPPKEFIDYLSGLKSKGKRSVLVSSESLFGTMNLAETKVIYPLAVNAMKVIKDQFAHQNVKVAFSTRNYADFVESSYKWKVGDGLALSFEDYLKEIDLDNLSWIETVQALLETFGKENVLLWEYELYRKDPTAIHLKLLRFFYGDVQPSQIKYPALTDINVSPNQNTLLANQKINQAVNSLDFLTKQQKKEARAKMLSVVQEMTFDDSKRPDLLDEPTRKKLNKKYKEDLAKLSTIYGKVL